MRRRRAGAALGDNAVTLVHVCMEPVMPSTHGMPGPCGVIARFEAELQLYFRWSSFERRPKRALDRIAPATTSATLRSRARRHPYNPSRPQHRRPRPPSPRAHSPAPPSPASATAPRARPEPTERRLNSLRPARPQTSPPSRIIQGPRLQALALLPRSPRAASPRVLRSASPPA